jgi:hypothetical protein
MSGSEWINTMVIFPDAALSSSFFKFIPKELYGIIFNAIDKKLLYHRLVCKRWQMMWFQVNESVGAWCISTDVLAFLNRCTRLRRVTLRWDDLHPESFPSLQTRSRFVQHPWSRKLTELCMITLHDIPCNLVLCSLRSLTANVFNILKITAPSLSKLTILGDLDDMMGVFFEDDSSDPICSNACEEIVAKYPLLTSLLVQWDKSTENKQQLSGFTLQQLQKLSNLQELDLILLQAHACPNIGWDNFGSLVDKTKTLLQYLPHLLQVCFPTHNGINASFIAKFIQLPAEDGHVQRLIANGHISGNPVTGNNFQQKMGIFTRMILYHIGMLFQPHPALGTPRTIPNDTRELLDLWFRIPRLDVDSSFIGFDWTTIKFMIRLTHPAAHILAHLIDKQYLTITRLQQMGPIPKDVTEILIMHASFLLETLQKAGIVEKLDCIQCRDSLRAICHALPGGLDGSKLYYQHIQAILFLLRQQEMEVDEDLLRRLFEAITSGTVLQIACRIATKKYQASVVYRAFYLSGRSAEDLKRFEKTLENFAPFDPAFIMSLPNDGTLWHNQPYKTKFCEEYSRL